MYDMIFIYPYEFSYMVGVVVYILYKPGTGTMQPTCVARTVCQGRLFTQRKRESIPQDAHDSTTFRGGLLPRSHGVFRRSNHVQTSAVVVEAPSTDGWCGARYARGLRPTMCSATEFGAPDKSSSA